MESGAFRVMNDSNFNNSMEDHHHRHQGMISCGKLGYRDNSSIMYQGDAGGSPEYSNPTGAPQYWGNTYRDQITIDSRGIDQNPIGIQGDANLYSMEESIYSDKLNYFRLQLHQLSKQKDGLMPKPDGTFPCDWLSLAWNYQALAEHVIRSAWPCAYPEGLLPCVSQQVEYLKRHLEQFNSMSHEEKDKFQRLYILAALGIIAKMKLVTFCWTFVELKYGEQRMNGIQSGISGLGPPFKSRRMVSAPDDMIPVSALEETEKIEYTTRSGRKTHRKSMKHEK